MPRSQIEQKVKTGVLIDSITDFSGGLNELDAPNEIAPNQSPDMSNVWLDTGTLKKCPGSATPAVPSITYESSATANANVMACPYDTVLGGVETLFLGSQFMNGSEKTTGNFIQYTTDGSTFISPSYSTGTASFAVSTGLITGSGTAWLSSGIVQPGDVFYANGGGGSFGPIIITAVNSDTQLAVTQGPVTNIGPTNYQIIPSSGYTYTTGTVSQTGSTPNVVGSGTAWLGTAQAGDFIIVNGNQYTIKSVNSNTSITLTTSPAGGFGGLTFAIIPAQPRVSFATFQGVTYAANGTSNLKSLTPSTYNNVPGSPACNFLLTVAGSYLFTLNQASYGLGSRVQWCAPLNAASWPGTFYQDINPNDGYNATGMFWDGQSVVIFKEKSVWKLTGTVFDPANQTYSLTQVYAPSSATWIYPNSIQFISNVGWVIFGGDGLYLYNGSSYISRITTSTLIQAEWNAAAAWVKNQVWGSAWSTYWNSKYRLSFGTTSGIPLDEHIIIERDGVSLWKGARNSGNAYGAPVVFNQQLWSVGGNNTLGFMQQIDTGSSIDGSAAINGSWTSRIVDYDEQQSFGRCWVDLKNQPAGNLVLSYSIDEGTPVNVNVDMTYAGPSGNAKRVKSPEITIGQVGQSIQFKLSNNTAGQDFEVYAITWERRPLRN